MVQRNKGEVFAQGFRCRRMRTDPNSGKQFWTLKEFLGFTLLIGLSTGLLFLACLNSWHWIFVTPIVPILSKVYGIPPTRAKPPEDIDHLVQFRTHIIDVGQDQKPCCVQVYPDAILILTKMQATGQEMADEYRRHKSTGRQIPITWGVQAEIPIAHISALLFEDKSDNGTQMGGFGIEYSDEVGSAMVMFFNQGYGCIRRIKILLAQIAGRYNQAVKGTGICELPIIDFPAVRKLINSEIVHRPS